MLIETSTLAQKNNDYSSLYKRSISAKLDTSEGRMYMRRLTIRVLCEMRLEETIRGEVNTP